ncbi:citrate synthase [Candidatus Nitronereus thalassa]|uniref:Citrate synthase n=1 Tax=Candidatus Nitronereus thalassa TaxID=3020898 RepID=A0ABU3K8I1_9BACT|nr:citrate synthase [Candidatus Nitronereus thalassa]MDT7042709.1 citrate synthase [Candidatus Nitronereus thalassa]
MSESVTMRIDDQSIDFPLATGTEAERVIDITKLRERTGLTAFDPGYVNTASCSSAITFLEGNQGILRYRGIPIEQLAEHSNFLETAYLLIYGELPSSSEYEIFVQTITRHTMLHEDVKRFFDGFPKDAHPMAILSAVIGGLSTFYQDSHDPTDPQQVEISTHRLLAKIPTIAAYSYKKSIGQPFVYPDNSLDYCSNFLRMMFSVPAEPYKANPIVAKALNLLFILHADHEQNCSTSTVRLVGSSHANLFASVSAGVYALWGPRHGGANQQVMDMLNTIHADNGNVEKYVEMAKDRAHPFRLFGFGHRVYKNYDPRAKILKQMCDQVLSSLGVQDPLVDIAKRLEDIALKDEFFISHKLYPNVDFYSGIIYKAIGFPVNMFTVLFAIGRLPGWIAHWREMMEESNMKIGRPRQLYTGRTQTEYVPMKQRN